MAGAGGIEGGLGRPGNGAGQVVCLPQPFAAIARRIASGSLLAGDVAEFLTVEARSHLTVPLVGCKVPAGFPSPADDHLDKPLDFNELLISNPAATFVIRIEGLSMIGAGIHPGDLAVVDKALVVSNGAIVLAVLNGEFTIKRYRQRGKVVWLQAENPDFKPVRITEEMQFEVWGVIKRSIRML